VGGGAEGEGIFQRERENMSGGRSRGRGTSRLHAECRSVEPGTGLDLTTLRS